MSSPSLFGGLFKSHYFCLNIISSRGVIKEKRFLLSLSAFRPASCHLFLLCTFYLVVEAAASVEPLGLNVYYATSKDELWLRSTHSSNLIHVLLVFLTLTNTTGSYQDGVQGQDILTSRAFPSELRIHRFKLSFCIF